MPQLGKKHFPYTKQGYEDYEKAVASALKKGGKVGKKKKKKVASRKKKRK
jgi:hypothetical protein